LHSCRGLSPDELRGIAELERSVVAADGGRLKLEWATLEARSGEQVEDLLWREGERLVGFLGLYAFGAFLELAGMVAPDARQHGIGTALLDAALSLARDRGFQQALLIVPRGSHAGRTLAVRRGATLHHSEHAMVLSTEPSSGPTDRAVSLRRAVPADATAVSSLLAAGFGPAAVPDLTGALASEQEQTLLIEVEGTPVGTLRLTLRGDDGAIYGFVVDPAWQGRGIGRDVLRRSCRQLRTAGASRVRLEVAVGNDRALGLYRNIGFVDVTTEDYYALPTR